MFAAAEGHSTLGIPKSVGQEFTAADSGGKLPWSAPKKSSTVADRLRKYRP
jgi:hypothetical protein